MKNATFQFLVITVFFLFACQSNDFLADKQASPSHTDTVHFVGPIFNKSVEVPVETFEKTNPAKQKVVSAPISVSSIATDCGEYDVQIAIKEKRKRNTIIQSLYWEEGTVVCFERIIDDPGREDIGCSNNRSSIVFKIQSGRDDYSLNGEDLNSLGCAAEVMGGNLMKEGHVVSSAQIEVKKVSVDVWLVVGYIDVFMEDIHAGGKQPKRFVLNEKFTKK